MVGTGAYSICSWIARATSSAGQFGDHGQSEIDAGGDAACGKQVAVAHHAALGRYRTECGEHVVRIPMRRGVLPAQQASGAEHQRAGADRADVVRLLRLPSQPVQDLGVLHQRVDARTAGHADDVELRAVAQRDVRQQA